MDKQKLREIPYNYTSADDELIVKHLFDDSVWDKLEHLKTRRVTGRSAKLLMRLMGDMFILQRNPYIYQSLADSWSKRYSFFKRAKADLDIIAQRARGSEIGDVIIKCREYLARLSSEIKEHRKKQKKIRKALGKIIGEENVCFDPFSLISHSTDATDWRLFLPVAVLRPTEEIQVAPLVAEIEKIGLRIIPRGAGTGLTGGAVPVSPNCVMINTEKLNHIRGIEEQKFQDDQGNTESMPVVELEAGVITQNAMNYASEKKLVFATDPTSAWACSIGGNIAENAGGKKAVMWGTAIDNLISYKIAMPGGKFYTVTRDDHKMRKILPSDIVNYTIWDEDGSALKKISLNGTDIRKKGLGKDITNKTLKGLPGIQKEGTDGIITSAKFILYPQYELQKTFCLEFFGDDMEEASKIVVAISKEFRDEGREALIALEHFDAEYMAAINYKVKAAMTESPKAALLIDMVAHEQAQIENGIKRLTNLLDNYDNTHIFVAKDEKEAKRFWRDRKKLGAIAARTNAFKLNEDIVLPLDALADFVRFADQYNISEDRYNQKSCVKAIEKYLETAEPIEDQEWLTARIPKAKEMCRNALEEIEASSLTSLKGEVQARKLLAALEEYFRGYDKVKLEIEKIFNESRAKQIIIATHMHAGDGNIHVNIPVFSNDMEMMRRASKTADDVMAEAVRLNGVVSGEHGIGITKMKYLDNQKVNDLKAYRQTVDPGNIMNPGQLVDSKIVDKVYTPSFNLLELEARILKYSSLEKLAVKIAPCVRCGKCKNDCCTFYPAKNMFLHPRNKNLSIASIIEAILYDAQRSNSTKFAHLKSLENIADHCTMCHKCYKPCPVNIDTAEVSILEREILTSRKYKHTSLATKATLRYLQTQNPIANFVCRETLVKTGGKMQRLGNQIAIKAPEIKKLKKLSYLEVFNTPVPHVADKTLRAILPACQSDQVLSINPGKENALTVFYFPGCGSERLFSDISKASLYILLKSGMEVVLPPPFLCCGFPAMVNAKKDQFDNLTLRNSIVFSKIRDMFNYITFKACAVSCGTCKEALTKMDLGIIFDAPVKDVSKLALDEGLDLKDDGCFLYHTPCHDSLEGEAGKMLNEKLGINIAKVGHCCSEGGTLSISRPDISNSMLKRKREEIKNIFEGDVPQKEILTNCPSCIQGLGRNEHLGIKPVHIATKLAFIAGGKNWEKELDEMVKKAEIITF